MPHRLPLAAFLAACACVTAGCGDDPRPAAPAEAVRLELTEPRDNAVTDEETVVIRGRVSPAASLVRVKGRDVASDGGTFSAEVDLDPGVNLVDVAASADGRRPETTAVRVIRRMPVEIPDLEGEAVEPATERLRTLGLRVEIREAGGLLDRLLPGDPRVCGTDPDAGERVRARTTVTVEVGKGC